MNNLKVNGISVCSENYFEKETELAFMGSTQFKSFMQCEAAALAKIKGEWKEEKSTALLVGGYVDAHFDSSLDFYISKNPEMLKKDGTLKAEFLKANEIIARAESDPFFMSFMAGKKQVIQTGEIAGVPFKTRIDSYFDDKLVDLKVVKDFNKVWRDGRWAHFIEAWRYDLQAAIYQAVDATISGSRKPFYIAALSKESVTDLAVFEFPQEVLDNAIYEVFEFAPKFDFIKSGEMAPVRCGVCDYCKSTKVLDSVISDYRDLIF